MGEYEKTPLIDLINRLNQIDVEKNNLDLEYLKICDELFKRIPTIKDEAKVLKKNK